LIQATALVPVADGMSSNVNVDSIEYRGHVSAALQVRNEETGANEQHDSQASCVVTSAVRIRWRTPPLAPP
jgi:hypothetical protein